MILYVDPLATSCRLILALVEHQGLSVDVRELSLANGDQRRPEHLAINPSGKVPVLIDGDFVLTESLAIARYLLAERDCDLYPSQPRQRARVDELLDWVSSGLAPHLLMGLVYPKLFAHVRFNIPAVDDAVARRALEITGKALQEVDQRLEESRAYLLGDTLTLADFALGAALIWAPVVPLSLDKYPHLAKWRSRMRALPAWRSREAVVEAFLA